jgi:hypothetical protein
MFKELAAVLGTHIDSPEFKAIQEKYFPAFKLGKNKDQYKDKATKIVLCFAALTSHDNNEPIPQDPNAFRYFTAFFFGKDESEIPFGVTSKDSEDTVYKKAGKPFITLANELFRKLKLKNTSCYEENKQNRVINGYTYSNNKFTIREHPVQEKGWIDFIPAGGIISNAEDLNRWDILLHKGKILKPATYKLMTAYNITSQHEAFGSEKIGYGYGIRINDKSSSIY